MSVRALARTLHCSCGSVLNRSDRLARQALAAQARLRPYACRREDVCIDGFVSFDCSQYFPNNLTIALTAQSRFILSFSHATLRRSGRMRADQKRHAASLYAHTPFEPHPLERSFTQLLDQLERDRPPRPNAPLVIITDEKLEYERAFCAHPLFRTQDPHHRVAHLVVSSRLPRTFSNPLFASNYLDRELRKDQAAHRRETVCFSRNVANGLSRLACYCTWHNYHKPFLVKAPKDKRMTHGEVAGIPASLIATVRTTMFSSRAFLSLLPLDTCEHKLWEKTFPSPGKLTPDYLPRFALQ